MLFTNRLLADEGLELTDSQRVAIRTAQEKRAEIPGLGEQSILRVLAAIGDMMSLRNEERVHHRVNRQRRRRAQ